MTELLVRRVEAAWPKIAARFAAATKADPLKPLVRAADGDPEGRHLVVLDPGGTTTSSPPITATRVTADLPARLYELVATPFVLKVGDAPITSAEILDFGRWVEESVVAAERKWLVGVIGQDGSGTTEATLDEKGWAGLLTSGPRVVVPVSLEARCKRAGLSHVIGIDGTVRTVPHRFSYSRLRPFDISWRRITKSGDGDSDGDRDDEVHVVASARVHVGAWDAAQSTVYTAIDPGLTG